MADKKVAARVVRGTGMSILLFFRTLELVSEKSQQRQKIILWYHVLFLSPMDPETYKLHSQLQDTSLQFEEHPYRLNHVYSLM